MQADTMHFQLQKRQFEKMYSSFTNDFTTKNRESWLDSTRVAEAMAVLSLLNYWQHYVDTKMPSMHNSKFSFILLSTSMMSTLTVAFYAVCATVGA